MTHPIANKTTHAQAAIELFKASVVKIHVTNTIENPHQPWCIPYIQRTTASAFIITNQWLVTNAHAVPNPVIIQVEMVNRTDRFQAKLKAIRYADDLALLTVDDPEFWQGTRPLSLTENLNIDASLKVVGFPGLGGLTLTRGTICGVSSAVMNPYGAPQSIVIRSNAAINDGNSGGPALDDDNKVLGVCFAVEKHSNQVGYIVPSEVLKRFLQEISDTGTCQQSYEVGLDHQCLINEPLRSFMGLSRDQSGVRILSVSPLSPLNGVLKAHDVLIKINDYAVHNDGNVNYSGNAIAFAYLFSTMNTGDSVLLKVIRGGKPLDLELSYKRPQGSSKLIDIMLPSEKSSYIILDGMAFRPLRLSTWEMQSEFAHLYSSYKHNEHKQCLDHQLVVMTQVFETPSTFAQHSHIFIVKKINGKIIGSLKDAIEALEHNQQSEHEIFTEDNHLLVLKNAAQANHMLELNKLGIFFDRSEDLRAQPLLFASTRQMPVATQTTSPVQGVKKRIRSC